MKKFLLKKQALIFTLVAALGVAVYLNYYFSDNGLTVGTPDKNGTLGEAVFVDDGKDGGASEQQSVAVDSKISYFDTARKNREKARDEAVNLMKDVAADIATDKTAAQKALDTATAIGDAVTREVRIEELVKAKGFGDCVVFIADKKCTVAVKADTLDATQSLQISEIVSAQSGISAQNINIMAVKS